MGNLEQVGRFLILGGVILALIGGLIWALGKFAGISQLAGTLRISGSGFTCLVPILGSILLSLVLTILLNVLARFLNR